MKFKHQVLLGLMSISLSAPALANKIGIPCSGVPGDYHTNPDSSIGGFVASTATVDSTVTVDYDASVCGRSTVIEGAYILDKAEVSGAAIIRGGVIISGNAKVYGTAQVLNLSGQQMEIRGNAKVYGRAFVQGSVTIQDEAQIFGWAKVLDFSFVGGDSRVCGISVVKGNDSLNNDQSKCVQKK